MTVTGYFRLEITYRDETTEVLDDLVSVRVGYGMLFAKIDAFHERAINLSEVFTYDTYGPQQYE
jgi:hypothetical protein